MRKIFSESEGCIDTDYYDYIELGEALLAEVQHVSV